MKTIFNLITIDKVQYNYFAQLDPADKLFYLFDVYEMHTVNKTKAIDLTDFFMDVRDSIQNETHDVFSDNIDRVDVMIDDQNIMIESNKLSAIRHIVNKFMESGYLLSRDTNMEKMFRKDKLTRYMRIFKIINRVSTICLN